MEEESITKQMEDGSIEVNLGEIFKDFKAPEHKNCKKCYGTKRLGFKYDPITKQRTDVIYCPDYIKEVEIAQNIYISNLNPDKRNTVYAIMQAEREGRLIRKEKV